MTRATRKRLERELKILRASLAGTTVDGTRPTPYHEEWARRHAERIEMLLGGAKLDAA